MATLSITKQYDDGITPTDTQIAAIQTSIETFVNNTKLNEDNIQAGGIGTASLGTGCVTRDKLVSVGQQIGSNVSSEAVTTSLADISGASITITTTGRPVFIGVQQGTQVGGNGNVFLDGMNGTGLTADFAILRDSTIVSYQTYALAHPSSRTVYLTLPASYLWTIDSPSAGTYTYKLQAIQTGTGTARFQGSRLIAYEL